MHAKDIDVVAVGNALVDLQARVEPAMLEGVGVAPGFMTLVDAERQRLVLDALEGIPVVASSGGSAANTVAGIAELGGRAAYACRVGDDEYGAFYIDDLRRLGVHVRDDRRASGPTGTCVVLITPDAQRTLLTHLGVSSRLSPDDLEPDVIGRAKWLYVEGYLLPGDGRDAALAAIGLAKEQGTKVALTVSDPWCVQACGETLWELIDSSVDLLFCNEAEAQALTGHADPLECAHAIHAHASSVALTYGARGSLLMHERELFPIEGVPCAAVDTTGAGDMYAAGILYGITQGWTWPAAGRLASHAASRVVASLGARLPSRLTPEEMRGLTQP